MGRKPWLLLLLASGCGAGGSHADAAADADPGSPQRPPRGRAALEPWLAEEHFRAWRCEPDVSPPRLSGNHGRQRICSNDALLASTSGPYPAGSASVKELYTPEGAANGFAVAIKLAPGDGPRTWYWYERRGAPGGPALAEGTGIPDCAVCHGMAGRDYVFFRAP
jgi:hypothetical protein